MPMISLIIIIILFVMLLTVFVGRVSELIIMKIQQKAMRPAVEKGLNRESIQGVRQVTP